MKTLQEFARRRKGAEEQREETSNRVTIQDLQFAGVAGENQLRGEKWIRAISQKVSALVLLSSSHALAPGLDP